MIVAKLLLLSMLSMIMKMIMMIMMMIMIMIMIDNDHDNADYYEDDYDDDYDGDDFYSADYADCCQNATALDGHDIFYDLYIIGAVCMYVCHKSHYFCIQRICF